MADRSSGISKVSFSNIKKKKNKSKKRKGSKISKKKSSKLDSPKNKDRSNNLHIQLQEDKYDNFLSEKNSFYNNERDYKKTSDIKQITSSPEQDKYKSEYLSATPNRSSVRDLRIDERQIYFDNNRLDDRRNVGYDNKFIDDEVPHGTSYSTESVDDLLQRVDYLVNQVETLRQENLRLNDALYNIQYNWTVLSDSDVDIIFKKKELSEKFSVVLKNLISNLLNGNISAEELDKFCSSKFEDSRNSPELDNLFAVDCSADPYESGNTSIPRYNTSFQEILQSPDECKNNSSLKSAPRFPKSCFNCGEDHFLNNCPQKLDYKKIAIARKQRVKTNFVSSLRYHAHGQNETDFKPGIISDELREALQLRKDQIPPYVYRMRLLDYPPGWLCDAAVESSGITLYGSDGNAEKVGNCEDSEVDPTGVKVQYDSDKLVDYPGFNVPLPPDIIDEAFNMGLPPLQTYQLRCFIEKDMAKSDVQPSRKRKPVLNDDRSSKMQRCEEDMEIEDDSVDGNEDSADFVPVFVPPLPESAPPPPPPPPPPPSSPPPPPPGEDSEISEDIILPKFPLDSTDESSLSAVDHFKIKACVDFSSGTSSPSLAELEELKKKLVFQLKANLTDDAPSSNASLGNDSADLSEDKNSEENYIIEDEFIASENSNELSNLSESSSSLNKTSDSPDTLKSLKRTESKSKLMTLGTPSLSRHSSYSKLPDYEKFSENVSDHIPFENLPNSTGTYSKMKNVLKKVKQKLNSLMQ